MHMKTDGCEGVYLLRENSGLFYFYIRTTTTEEFQEDYMYLTLVRMNQVQNVGLCYDGHISTVACFF